MDDQNKKQKDDLRREKREGQFHLEDTSDFFRRLSENESARTLGTGRKMSTAIQKEALMRAEEEKKQKYGKRVFLECVDVLKQYKQYDSVVTAVNRATFHVLENEFVAIIGTSGSGKSTLLHLCAGLDRPNAGTIRIGGEEITGLSADALGRFRGQNIGMVFQNHNLLPQFTAMENILIPTLMTNKPEIQYEGNFKELITALKIADRLHHLPSELSGGQHQRVSIARALINSPKIVLADEPTGNLDRKNADEVLELLLAMRETMGQTLVMVTHDLSIAERADRVFSMEDGILTPYRG
jgi:ABC-type lipoprotein export system ATPase subunit